MAKKNTPRKARSSGTPTTVEQISAVHRSKADLMSDYSYVIADLRRIGILSAALIAGLVILSFFLR